MAKNVKVEKGFVKILASDLDDTAALKLITELRTQSIFKDASVTDLRSFSLIFSLLRLDAGDKLIQRDEDATFFGLVLKGTFASVLEPNGIGSPTSSHGTVPTPSAAFRKGDIIGEDGWNEPGKRNCDVVAATQAVIAVLTYEDLRSQVMSLAPELAARIIPFLTKRSTSSTITATATSGDTTSASASSTSASTSSSTPSTSTSTSTSTSAPASSPATLSIPAELQSPSPSPSTSLDIPSNGISPALSKSTSAATLKYEPELLFRLRFKRHPPSRSRRIIDLKSISTSVSSPPHSPSGNDIMKENNVKNLTYMVSMLKGKLAKSDELLAEKDTLLSSKDDEIHSLHERLLHEQSKHQELLDRFVHIQAELVDERRSRIDAMTETATLRQQIHAIQNDATEHRMREAKKQQMVEEERNREFEKKSEEQHHTILSKQQSLDRLRAHITCDTQKLKELQHRYEIEHDTAEQYRIHAMKMETELNKLRLKLGEAERRQIQLLKWKSKAHEFAETWESERKRFKRRLNRAYDMNDTLVTQLNAYKKILRVVSVAGYVKNFLARKSLRLLFTHLCELTTQSLIEQGTQAPRLANSVQLDTSTDLEVRTAKQMNTWPWNVKHANIVKLVKAVDGEVAILAESLAIVHRQKRRWQETCDSFFTRNIELTNQYVSHDGALQIATKRATTLRSQSKTLAQQYMALQEQLQRTIREKESIATELLTIQKQDRDEKHTQKQQVNSLFDRSVDLRRRATTLEHHVQDLTTQENHLNDTIAKLQHERSMLQRVISQDKAHLLTVTSEIQQHTIPMGTTQVIVPPRPSTSPATSTYQRYNNTQEITDEQQLQPSRPASTVQHLALSNTPLPLASPAAANSYATTSSSPITSLPAHQRDYAKKRHMLSSFHQSIINRAMNKFSPIRTSRTTGLYAGIGTGISTTRRPHTSEGIRSKVHTIAVPTTKQSQSPPTKSHHLSPSPPSQSQSQSSTSSETNPDVYSHDTYDDATYKDITESKEEQHSDDLYNDDEFHPTET